MPITDSQTLCPYHKGYGFDLYMIARITRPIKKLLDERHDMSVKKKLSQVKSKIKENRVQILAVVSTGIAIAASVAYVVTNDKLKKAWEGNRSLLEERANQFVAQETVWISDETEKQINDGSKDVWFDVNGKRFDLTLHQED